MKAAIETNSNDFPQDSEAQALSDIIIWSESRCAWQRDALRRLCQSAELTPADIQQEIDVLKTWYETIRQKQKAIATA